MKKFKKFLLDIKEAHCLLKTPADYPMSFHDSIQHVSQQDWTTVQSESNNIFLSYNYLKAVEESQSQYAFRYLVFYRNHMPVAIAYVQVLQIKLAESLNFSDCQHFSAGKELLFGDKASKVLICGNVFSSGENGFAHSNTIGKEEAYNALMNALCRLRRNENALGDVSSVVIKEFWEKNYDGLAMLNKNAYRGFEVEPNLVLRIESSWHKMQDYLGDITKKYRKRYRDVMKKSEGLLVREFSAEEIADHSPRIKELFDAVHEKADFKFGHFNAAGFYDLKRNLHDQFIFKAYYLDAQLVAFAALFVNGEALDANYIGLDYDVNKTHCLYHRMLFDFVDVAIDQHCNELFYGRTASEIKSSIGAVPVNMKLYLRHRNTLGNQLLKPLLKFVQPTAFEVRNPFKTEEVLPTA